MRSFRLSGPSPAMVVACVALSFALAGSAVAGTDALDRAVTKSKVKQIAKKQGKKQAKKQLRKNVSGSHVNLADNATNANNATNLGGQPPSAYALATSEPYHTVGGPGEPPFQNGWTNFSPTFSSAAFYRDSLGVVHLKGTLSGGASGTVAFTLPAGYRPALELFMPLAGGGPQAANMQVRANGEVELTCAAACGAAGIDGLSFRAGS